MEWFEPLIAIAAIALVILPFILNHKNKKTGKPSCTSDCSCCSSSGQCMHNFKEYLKEREAHKK